MNSPIEDTLKKLLTDKLLAIEAHLNADVLVYNGNIGPLPANVFLNLVEDLQKDPMKHETLFVILTTNGGSAEMVERYVNILRHHYLEINFIVPDYAYSAGTIFCMSGDSIYMDYFSVLGPIDPQVLNKEGKYIAALGYLDKVNEFVVKAANRNLTNAELIWMKEIDLGELRSFEQARDLTIDLLKKWLVVYKFKSWNQHRNGNQVTLAEKQQRAEEIAKELSDNKVWKSHGKGITISELTNLKLKIEDYSNNQNLRSLIRDYYNTMDEYVRTHNLDYLFKIVCLYNSMAESDNYMRLVGELQTDEHIKQTLEEMESFYSYEEYMGVFSKKKLLLKTREEMKFEIANSNLH